MPRCATYSSGAKRWRYYATTESVEALTLGGQIAILHEGRLLQSGAMLEAYHRPATLTVSQVFSDPPFNLIDGEIETTALRLVNERHACPVHLRSLAAGLYRFAIRPSHLFVERRSDADITFDGVVDIAEISGSEAYIHLQHSDRVWVVQEDGVHRFSVGETIALYFDPRHLYAYRQDGRLAATPTIAPTQYGSN